MQLIYSLTREGGIRNAAGGADLKAANARLQPFREYVNSVQSVSTGRLLHMLNWTRRI